MLEITKDNQIIVPKGIRYISDWKDYNLSDFNFPHILDKKIPGCGFTEYCLTSNLNVILCSPRKILLSNKEAQHPDTVLYFKNELESDIEVDKDITKISKLESEESKETISEIKRKQVLESMENQLNNYVSHCRFNNMPAKILVTYDSFRLVKQLLINRGVFELFYVVVDEFQSVFSDASFKSDTELGFVDQLAGIEKLCYVSATPMIHEYLVEMDEFKNLPYYELDWKTADPLRVTTPDVKTRSTQSITATAKKIIKTYLDGDFEELATSIDGTIKVIKSTEAVLYVNSVKNICDIIDKCKLKPGDCNILCANTSQNLSRIQKRLGKGFSIGEIPLRGQEHKMFTFCTRTVYLGADFYSTCARTFILSDVNIKTLAVDITLDLPQILGRQRLTYNPWKNKADLYVKTLSPGKTMTKEEFRKKLEEKIEETTNLLSVYKKANDKEKYSLAKNYLNIAKTANYKDNYVAVNTHGGTDLVPVFNTLVKLAEQRAFDIQTEGKDWYSVFNALYESSFGEGSSVHKVSAILKTFRELPSFYDKIKFLCEQEMTKLEESYILGEIPVIFRNYYEVLGPERCRACGYRKQEMDKEISDMKIDTSDLENKIILEFPIGSKILKSEIKQKLGEIYSEFKYNKTPKATDLEEYFELRTCKITNSETGKRDMGFEIIKKK